jgi:hypothetical protein
MPARIDHGRAQLLTRTGLDWTDKYPSVIAALAKLNVKTAHLDGELCGVDDAGLPSFAQTAARRLCRARFQQSCHHQRVDCPLRRPTAARAKRLAEEAMGETGGVRSVSLLPKRKRQFAQPPLNPVLLDGLEVLTVHARRALVGAALRTGLPQKGRRIGTERDHRRRGEAGSRLVRSNRASGRVNMIGV